MPKKFCLSQEQVFIQTVHITTVNINSLTIFLYVKEEISDTDLWTALQRKSDIKEVASILGKYFFVKCIVWTQS